MDELKSFMNNQQPPETQTVRLRGPLTGGVRITRDDDINLLNRREDHRHSVLPSGTDYVTEVQKREIQTYVQNEMERQRSETMSLGIESMEQLSIHSSMPVLGQLADESMNQIYNKYSFKIKEKSENYSSLSINDYKDQILESIRGFPVVIVEGPTGCGKTTQVPQWILDDCYTNRKQCKIVVTQPRRIAAISIAKRVAQERGWDLGGLVGYQVGLDNQTTLDTRIQYVTTGVLLQKLVGAKNMNEYTHVILDEVHERGQEMDFLLLIVKRLLYTVSPTVKVVLMSATFNSSDFAEYFRIPTPIGLQMAKCINVEKKKVFTVKTFYLNHLSKFGSILQSAQTRDGSPMIMPEMYHLVIKLINAFEHIDMQEDGIDRSTSDMPSVLVFLPGINEIEDLYNCLMDTKLRTQIADAECARYNWQVLPLHSTITADEQVRVFHRAPPGARKIILSTNIAESSITVPDIKYVIDFCRMKVLVADDNTNFTSLQLSWASKSNCNQRAGRAGRVRDGRVYRLVTDKFYDTLPDECQPEIVRCPLERLVLLAKMLDMGPPSDILALAMNPPDISNIYRTTLVLKEMGALKKTLNKEWVPADGDITYLGRIMAKLPIDVRLSKLIVLGYIFGCLDECVIMAAAMSVKNVFNSPFRERLNAYNSKLTWADGSTSDCIAFLNVYRVWNHLRQQQYFKQPGNNEVQWAKRFFVQLRALKDMDDLVREMRNRLSREGIDQVRSKAVWAKNELSLALKILLAGAFYPQYFIQVTQDEAREREAVRTLAGLDPRNTVYLKNFPDSQPGEVYAAAIKQVTRQHIGDEPRVTFDKNSQKVYLTFEDNQLYRNSRNNSGDPTIPGQVVLPVYKALKAFQLKMDFRIPLLPVEKANALARMLETRKNDLDIRKMVPRLPDLDDTAFPLKICHRMTVSRFWVRYDDHSTSDELQEVHRALNGTAMLACTKDPQPGELYAAPRAEAAATKLHRVRVQKLLPKDMVEVHYIDWGSYSRVSVTNLLELPMGACRNTPPLVMQCVLAEVAPSALLEPHGKWSDAAYNFCADITARGRLFAKVYSVTHGVVSIELMAEGGRISINKELIARGLAVPCEESYDSKMNHDLREMASDLNLAQKRAHNKEQTELAFYQLWELDAPQSIDCVTDVCLKGPYSPLETVLHNLMYSGREKKVVIEWHSVNSVLLDTEPQALYERLLVAASVGQNEQASQLTLRHTTLMPNIPGLPAILSLIFCPVSELRRDDSGTRYVSALCGLGSDDHGRPYFPEHDLLVNIDTELSVTDLSVINHMRHLMDYMLYCPEGQDAPTADDEYRPQVPGFIRNDILELLMKRRKHRENESVKNAWEWLSADGEKLEICSPEMVERAVIFPLHAPLALRPVARDLLMQLKRDNDQLKLLVTRSSLSTNQEVQCKLCNTGMMPMHAMRIHLYSNAHNQREEDFQMCQS